MAKKDGTTRYWTEDQEKFYERLLAGCESQAVRNLIMTIRDLVKYDGRTKQAKRSIAQARLRIATATDEELAELAKLEFRDSLSGQPVSSPFTMDELKQLRQSIREKGITKKEITA